MKRFAIVLSLVSTLTLTGCGPMDMGGYSDDSSYYDEDVYVYRDPYYGRAPIYPSDVYVDRYGVWRDRRTGYEVHRLRRENEHLRREVDRLEDQRDWERHRREELEHRPMPVPPPCHVETYQKSSHRSNPVPLPIAVMTSRLWFDCYDANCYHKNAPLFRVQRPGNPGLLFVHSGRSFTLPTFCNTSPRIASFIQ